MRLSEWRANAPVRDALGAKVMAVVAPVLGVLDVEDDPHAWVLWGDDPGSKYTIYAPIAAGLVVVAVRISMGDAIPRATAKIVRWSRLQLGELAVETEGVHRMISFQLESNVIRGADDVADAVGRFALVVFAAVEGRTWPPFDAPGRRRPNARAAVTAKAARGARDARDASAARASTPANGKKAPAPAAAQGAGRTAARPEPKLPALPARTATPTGPRPSVFRTTTGRESRT